MNQKHDIYKFMFPIVGCGLISASGPKYKMQKRLIHPTINIDFVKNSLPFYHRSMGVLVEALEKHVDGKTFNVEKVVHLCFADILSNVYLGLDLNSQYGQNTAWLETISKSYEVVYERMVRPWQYPDFFFNLTKSKKVLNESVHYIHSVIDKVGIFYVCISRLVSRSKQNIFLFTVDH